MMNRDGVWADPNTHLKCSHCGIGYKPPQGTGDHCPGCAELKFGRQARLGEFALTAPAHPVEPVTPGL